MNLKSKASFCIGIKGISGKLILLFLCVILQLRFPVNIQAGEDSGTDIGEELELSSDIIDMDEFISGESPFSFQGHYKNLVTYFSTDNYLDENENRFKYKKLVADVSRIRLSPEIRSRGNFMLHCDIDNEIIAANYVKNKIFDLYW
ncbi:MAG: hypothetical protein GY795_51370, partial [Desulfobacterales bacterium]|nr:hypothetical protein [Desulfobacterales bacterium]